MMGEFFRRLLRISALSSGEHVAGLVLAGVACLAFEEAFLAAAVVMEYLAVLPLACLALVNLAFPLGLVELAYAISGSSVAYLAFGCLLDHRGRVSFLLSDIYPVLLGYIFAFSFHCGRIG